MRWPECVLKKDFYKNIKGMQFDAKQVYQKINFIVAIKKLESYEQSRPSEPVLDAWPELQRQVNLKDRFHFDMDDTSPSTWPSKDATFHGHFVSLTPLAETYIDDLWPIVSSPEVTKAEWWEYLHAPPITTYENLKEIVEHRVNLKEGQLWAILDSTSQKAGAGAGPGAVGWVSLANIALRDRKADVGIFLPSPSMQKTPRSTEAIYLLLSYAFEELDFECLYWKTDALNSNSRRAAERLGFVLLQVVAGAAVVEGKIRNMAIYRLKRESWEVGRVAMKEWLEPSNFEEDGVQRKRLEEVKEKLEHKRVMARMQSFIDFASQS